MTRFRRFRAFLVISIAFFILTAITLVLERQGFIFTFDTWTVIPALLLFFSLGGPFLAVFLFLVARTEFLRFGVILLALIGLYIVSVMGILSSARIRSIQDQGYRQYVRESRCLFEGEDEYFLETGFLLARRLAVGCQGEDCTSGYSIEGDELVIHEFYYGGPEAGDETRVSLE